MDHFNTSVNVIGAELSGLIEEWFPILSGTEESVLTGNVNRQNRNIKQIVGHMIDSASNNTHRIVHFQYRNSPLDFPDYANLGMNDRWIAIQNYTDENWVNLLYLWKYIHFHFIHVISNADENNLEKIWISATGEKITMKEMILDFPRHFRLHIEEIKELINK